MVMVTTLSVFLAQAYGCGAYGEETYNQCSAAQTASGTPQTQEDAATGAASTATAASDTIALQTTTVPARDQPSIATTIANTDYSTIFIGSLAIAVIVAAGILGIKAFRRRLQGGQSSQ